MASLKNALKPTEPIPDSHPSQTGVQSHSHVKNANQKSGESIIYIQSFIARAKRIQHSAISIIAKNIVTIRLSQKLRTMPIKLLIQDSEV
jgi:hypothetical protein